jgi:hypothetical protein
MRRHFSCAVQDDNRGVAEALNETMCGCTQCNCPGLVVRGTFQILLLPAEGAAAHVREAEVLANDPPLLLAARGREVLAWLLAHTARPENGHAADVMPKTESHSEQEHAEMQGKLGDKGLVLKRMLALGYHGAALARAFTGVLVSSYSMSIHLFRSFCVRCCHAFAIQLGLARADRVAQCL